MRVWVVGCDSTGQIMAAALTTALRALAPGHDYAESPVDGGLWDAVAVGDGVLLCVTPIAAAAEQVYYDLGRLQAAVGTDGFVAPVLMDLTPEDLAQTPLSIFQSTRAQRNDLEALVADLGRRAAGDLDPSAGDDAERAWTVMLQQIGDVPGGRVQLVVVTLMLPERQFSFGFDGGGRDAPWSKSIGTVLESLPGSPLEPPPFEPGTLVPLDVETGRWIELPRRLSRIRTSHLALVSPAVIELSGGDARILAFRAREHAENFSKYGGQRVLPWKFLMSDDDKLVVMRNVR